MADEGKDARRQDTRRQTCDALAGLAGQAGGLRLVRLLQLLGGRGTSGESAGRPAGMSERSGAEKRATAEARQGQAPVPEAIGPWEPHETAEHVVFVRREPPVMGDPWAPPPVLTSKQPGGPRRVVLLGESTAAGWFYAPAATPARILEQQLRETAGDGRYEVVDLAKVDLKGSELVALARASLQLQPDVLVVFAGNNWPTRFQSVPPEGHLGSLEAARVFMEVGAPGLARLAEETTLSIARQVLRQIAALSREVPVPVVLVVPEVNLRDWPRARPVVWLPGGASAEWHFLRSQAADLLDRASHAEAVEVARKMIALDEGTCPTSYRLLATALLGLGNADGASAACRAEVDARAWDNFPSMPGATTGVQEVLRHASIEHGFRCVDLPAVFARYLCSPLPGARVLLDYCHLSAEGAHVAMASVAAEILALGGSDAATSTSLTSSLPPSRVPPDVDARAKLLTALYHAHWASPADGRPPATETWLSAALEAWPGIAETMLAYAATRAAPRETLLFCSEQQRLLASSASLPPLIWNMPSLDPEVLLAICTVLERAGKPVRDRVEAALLRHHAADNREIDLLDLAYLWGAPGERALSEARGLHRFFWPSAHFCLVAGGSCDLTLELVVRLPRIGPPRTSSLEVFVNGGRAASVSVTDRWTRQRLPLHRGLLRRGINRLTFVWPVLPPEGDAALASLRERLQVGIGAELHPVFGELLALRAGPHDP